jgi:hypothetical protein
MRRTQIYLSEDQRRLLDRAAKREGVSVAEIIRQAVDEHFGRRDGSGDAEAILSRTAGALPKLEVPSRREWDRGYG